MNCTPIEAGTRADAAGDAPADGSGDVSTESTTPTPDTKSPDAIDTTTSADIRPNDASTVDGASDRSAQDASADAPDGNARDGLVDATPGDAEPPGDAGPCNPLSPFGVPVPLLGAVNSDNQKRGAALSRDELTMYFAMGRNAMSTTDLYRATRPRLADPFGTPAPLAAINSPELDRDCSLSADGLTLYFSSAAPPELGGFADIIVATRATLADDFAGRQPLSAVNSVLDDFSPFITYDGLTLYLGADSGGIAGAGIYRATRSSVTSAFGALVPVDELNSSDAHDGFPVLTDDELAIYFSSQRKSIGGYNHIWTSHRATRQSAFDAPTAVTELNSPDTGAVEWPVWLSPDTCRLYMVSNRDGYHNLYVATKPK